MNYGEIKHNLISLGFAEESDLEEYEDLGYLYDAVNMAISEIGVQFPYKVKYEFEIDENETDLIYIDMEDRPGFLRRCDTPILFERDGEEHFTPFSDYDIEMDNTLVINPKGNQGSYRVYYEKECTLIDANTEDSFVPELPRSAHRLIPLLAAYYLWLDDEEAKATVYYNMYEQKLAQIANKETKPRMEVFPDRKWGVI